MRRLLSALVLAASVLAPLSAIAAQQFFPSRTGTYESTLNSTSTVLSGGATFTGTAEVVFGYSQINCFQHSDKASAVNGYSLEVSVDGTNWDRVKTFSTTAAESEVHQLAVIAKYFRAVYINGSVTQSDFHLQCSFTGGGAAGVKTSSDETIGDFSDVTLVRLAGDHDLDVAEGLIEGHEIVRIFGHNPSVGGLEAVWSAGGDYTGFLTTAANIEVKSSSADDDTDGAGNNDGAVTVVVDGLDENFLSITETFTMNGTTVAVATGETSWIRIQDVHVETSATYSTTVPSSTGANVGVISVNVESAGALLATIEAQAGHSEMAIYTVPADKIAYLKRVEVGVSVAANKDADVFFWQRPNADDVTTPFSSKRIIQAWDDMSGEEIAIYDLSVSFQPKTDLWFSADQGGSGDPLVDVHFELHLAPNVALPAPP